jgi:hypothetical protein
VRRTPDPAFTLHPIAEQLADTAAGLLETLARVLRDTQGGIVQDGGLTGRDALHDNVVLARALIDDLIPLLDALQLLEYDL